MKTIKTIIVTQAESDILTSAQHILSNICCEFEQGDDMNQCQICPLHFCCDYYNSSGDTLPNNIYDFIRNLQVEPEGEEK